MVNRQDIVILLCLNLLGILLFWFSFICFHPFLITMNSRPQSCPSLHGFPNSSHLIPFTEIAKLLAANVVSVTVFLTPLNAARLNNVNANLADVC